LAAILNNGDKILHIKMSAEFQAYNNIQTADDKEICSLFAPTIDCELTKAESKIWHAHPVWVLAGNQIVGYSKQKAGWRLMFWSGRILKKKN